MLSGSSSDPSHALRLRRCVVKKALALKRVATVLLFGVAFQLGNSVLAKLVAIEVDISAFKAQVASSGKPRFYLTRTTQNAPRTGQTAPTN